MQCKQGIVSLMSTCVAIYTKTRSCFESHVQEYLQELTGMLLSVGLLLFPGKYLNVANNFVCLKHVCFVPGGAVSGAFPYRFSIELDTSRNVITGQFHFTTHMGPGHDVTLSVAHYDVVPVFGEYCAEELRYHSGQWYNGTPRLSPFTHDFYTNRTPLERNGVPVRLSISSPFLTSSVPIVKLPHCSS
jgi:hypothetical protein